ncbi:MAG TPA: LysM peptidoglycan-binding domain-containing protein [Burkholderiaceae bacterium]|nr:LysM peptidoglycan-binding domain-containing protein [Burkholderiaceae bacterium]HQR69774.1 LysM peptidoglycan-binding domain-containing protein [Burkholderiaceae bacterium]
MKKTSMGVLAVVACATAAGSGIALAQEAAGRYPITNEQRATADQVAQAGVPLSALSPNAPESYTVKRGDTLWGLSSMYLTSPWRWPELWGMNRQQIANPHLIYPGQELRLVKENGRARLEIAGGGSGDGSVAGEAKLLPHVREASGDRAAIRSIPSNLIEPFLSQPLVLEPNALDGAARIIATQEGRVYVGRGDDAYARGIKDDSIKNYSVFRPLRPLYDPDDVDRKRPIAYEAKYLGSASMVRPGEVAKVHIDSFKEEIGLGDRMLPVEGAPILNYMPKAPNQPVEARVIAAYDDVQYAGGLRIITLNRGSSDGLVIGDVLQLWRSGETIRDRTLPGNQYVKLPDEPLGLGFVFRVFPGISYALVQRATMPVQIGDRASDPTEGVDLPRLRTRETEADRVLRQPLRPLNIQ